MDGATRTVARFIDEGHGLATLAVTVAPGRPTKVRFYVGDPGGPLRYRQQPLAVDDRLRTVGVRQLYRPGR